MNGEVDEKLTCPNCGRSVDVVDLLILNGVQKCAYCADADEEEKVKLYLYELEDKTGNDNSFVLVQDTPPNEFEGILREFNKECADKEYGCSTTGLLNYLDKLHDEGRLKEVDYEYAIFYLPYE
jgi:hypothetical protein